MKILFLDFDGVLTSYSSKRYSIDIEKIKLINRICKETDAKIVVTSTWRKSHDISSFKKFLIEYFNKHKYRDDLKLPYTIFIDNIIDITDTDGCVRGDEIKRWIDKYSYVDSYAIFDDDSDMLDEQLFHFVQIDTYEGITEREVKLAIDILNDIEVINPIRLNSVLKFRWQLWCYYPQIENNIKEMLKKYRNKQKIAK